MTVLRIQVESELDKLMKGHIVAAHEFDHFLAVTAHAVKACERENLTDQEKLQVEIAALLHDADDNKIFPSNHDDENARAILQRCTTDTNFIEAVIQMIRLVSCSKNGDSEPPVPWMAIPRDCDRLEAIGKMGIKRCYDYSVYKKRPLHLATTPRATTEAELATIVTLERFEAYMNGKQSETMIDHYYDKLLHIGKPEHLRSQNIYILAVAAQRTHEMIEYILNYWKDIHC